jgi:chitinase
LRLAGATTYSFNIVAVDPSGNASQPSAAATAITQPSTDTAGPAAPGLVATNADGCETWLSWSKSVDDVDPSYAILYEVYVNGVFDGAQVDTDRWITYGTQSTNTYSVRAVDSAGNRAPLSSVTLTGQTC